MPPTASADLAPVSAGVPATAHDDSALLGRIRDGDQLALAELYDHLGGRAFGLALHLLGERRAAEDAVQEAFITLWKQAARLDPVRGRVTSLLMTIVHHRCVDVLRRRRGTVTRSMDYDFAEPAHDTAGVDEIVERAMDRHAVRRAVDGLPEDQRRTVQMAYFDGATHIEIARIMGVPGGTVKSRLRLALQKMRTQLGAEFAY